MNTEIRVLFLQSQERFWPSVLIHSLLMRYFDRKRVEVYVACTSGTKHEKPPSLQVLETIPGISLRLTNFGPTITHRAKADIAKSAMSTGIPALVSLLGLVGYVKRHKIDIIHTADKPRDAFYGVLLAKLTGTKIIIHLHMPCEAWIGKRMRWALEKADCIIGVSEFVKQTVIANGYSEDRVHTVLNGIEFSSWNYEVDGNTIRHEFGIAPNVPLLSIIGRMVIYKGHERLLNALVKVKNCMPSVKLLIVGEDDPDLTAELGGVRYSDVLKKKVCELGLSEQVIFAGYRSDIQQILAACDLYVMPTIGEACSVAVLEAMAMKKPVVTLDSGGTPEEVEHGKSGLLSPPEDILQLAENILTLINNPTLRRQMGEYGRAMVEQKFNPHQMAASVEHVYRLMLEKQRVPMDKKPRRLQRYLANRQFWMPIERTDKQDGNSIGAVCDQG